MHPAGVLLCLLSAVAFGAMAIFGKLAYDEGATVGTVLAVRFLLAAAVFWAALAATGALRRLRRLSGRDLAIGVLLGAVGYSAQAGAFFAALARLDASLLSLVLYTFPAMVTVAAIALGREPARRRTVGALVIASAGLYLLLSGAAAGALDPLGTALGIAAAAVYSTYILSSQGVAGRADPLVLSALVCTGAAATLTVVGAAGGYLRPGEVSAAGFGWLAALALVSTVAAIGLFFAGLRRVGPTAASILSTAEPVTTVVLAWVVFGESLTAVQVGGGGLVLAAALLLSVPRRRGAPARADAGPEPAYATGAGS